jgi:hypothetical protein
MDSVRYFHFLGLPGDNAFRRLLHLPSNSWTNASSPQGLRLESTSGSLGFGTFHLNFGIWISEDGWSRDSRMHRIKVTIRYKVRRSERFVE